MQPIEEILKEFDRRSQHPPFIGKIERAKLPADSLLYEDEDDGNFGLMDYHFDPPKVRAFIEQALIKREKEAKLERTKEILEMVESKMIYSGVDEIEWKSLCWKECLSKMKELLTKTHV